RLHDLYRLRAEILLEDDALAVHQEGHDTALAVLRGPRHHREAARHLAVLHVVLRAARSVRTLCGEDAEEVAVERLRRGARLVHGVPFPSPLGEERSEGTLVAPARALPVEAVVLAGLAADLLREDAAGIESRVLRLGVDVRTQGSDHRQLVVTDAAAEQLVLAGGGVETPLVPVLHERD